MKKILKQFLFLVIFLSGFLAWGNAEAATNYYVDGSLGSNCTGNYSIANRNCTGTDGDAYTTVQAAVDATVAGDTVYIRTGTYAETVTTKTDGIDESGRITIKNYGSEEVSFTGFTFRHNYNTLQGVSLTGRDLAHTVYIYSGANYSKLLNSTVVTDLVNRYSAVYWYYSGGIAYANNCTISGNVLQAYNVAVINMWGNNNIISNNTISGAGIDGIYIQGIGNIITGNSITATGVGGGNHLDCFQHAGDASMPSNNILIERNICNGGEYGGQACRFTQYGAEDTGYYTLQNNIFLNIAGNCEVYVPHAKVYNNTFYNVGTYHAVVTNRNGGAVASITRANPGVVTLSANHHMLVKDSVTRKVSFSDVGGMTELNGNTYTITVIDYYSFSIGVDTSSYGEYTSGGFAKTGGSDYISIKNNAFIGCGDNPASTAQGWYLLTNTLTGQEADYNYVAGTSYAAKGAAFTEANGVNGGNPYLRNEGGTAASDYALTSSSSILRDQGVDIAGVNDDYAGNARSNTDIGAYEYTGAGDVIAPASPTGLSVS